jgi:biotin-(acetyl-CoA carboxylase) ligase
VQKKSISNDTDFLRIGIGINTDSQTPQLPSNDQLAQTLYSEPTTLSIGPERWIDLASNLRTNIMKSLDINQHENYLRSLNIKHWDDIQIWGDDGTITFWKKMARWQLDTIDRDGNIHLIWETSSIRLSDYHIQLMGRI